MYKAFLQERTGTGECIKASKQPQQQTAVERHLISRFSLIIVFSDAEKREKRKRKAASWPRCQQLLYLSQPLQSMYGVRTAYFLDRYPAGPWSVIVHCVALFESATFNGGSDANWKPCRGSIVDGVIRRPAAFMAPPSEPLEAPRLRRLCAQGKIFWAVNHLQSQRSRPTFKDKFFISSQRIAAHRSMASFHRH